MVHYKPVKVTINASGLMEVIFDVVVRHHGFPDSIVSDWDIVFMSKFWSSLCYFLRIKRRLSTAFYPQTNSQTKKQNSTMEAYLQAFVNYEQNDWAKLLPIAKFAYNHAKNVSIGHTPFVGKIKSVPSSPSKLHQPREPFAAHGLHWCLRD